MKIIETNYHGKGTEVDIRTAIEGPASAIESSF